MSNSSLDMKHARMLYRTVLIIIMVLGATLLSGCGGGLFGTGDSTDSSVTGTAGVDNSDNFPTTDEADPPPIEPETSPGPIAPTDPDDLSFTIEFSNTTPSGIDTTSAVVPALKLINLTDSPLTLDANGQSVTASAQDTSDLLGVNTGETQVEIRLQDSQLALASITPLNAVEDSITTLVMTTEGADTNTIGEIVGTSLLALDTRAVASDAAMADVRVVSTRITSNTQARYTLSPMESNSSGAELLLNNANNDNPAVGVYALASAGDYLLSSSDSGFAPLPITLLAGGVYTILITDSSSLPVYVEVDNVPAIE